MKKRLLLIDTSALFHRSRSALMRACGELTTSAGVPITGTMGFLNAMFAVMANRHGQQMLDLETEKLFA